jgi:hypothetical protein
VEGRADGLRTSIAAVSAHGAAAFLFSCCVWFDLAVEKKEWRNDFSERFWQCKSGALRRPTKMVSLFQNWRGD